MKVVVCVKHVPSGRWRVDPGSMCVDRSGPGELNRSDRNAIEEAVRLKERTSATEVVALCMGPEQSVESLRTVLALGVDRAILVSDKGAEGSDLLGTAKVLAAVVDRESPDLVLFGQQTADGMGGVLVAAVADLTGSPFASQAARLEVDDRVRISRQTETGDEVIDLPLPALISVGDSINEPRYTSVKGLMAAKKKPLEVLALADIGLEPGEVGHAGARTVVLALGAPPVRSGGVRIEDESGAARAIVEFLMERELV